MAREVLVGQWLLVGARKVCSCILSIGSTCVGIEREEATVGDLSRPGVAEHPVSRNGFKVTCSSALSLLDSH